MMFLVFSRREDSPTIDTFYSEKDLKHWLRHNTAGLTAGDLRDRDWTFEHFPANTYWIIRGEPVIPKPVQAIVDYEV